MSNFLMGGWVNCILLFLELCIELLISLSFFQMSLDLFFNNLVTLMMMVVSILCSLVHMNIFIMHIDIFLGGLNLLLVFGVFIRCLRLIDLLSGASELIMFCNDLLIKLNSISIVLRMILNLLGDVLF
jgi:hypothetical protein